MKKAATRNTAGRKYHRKGTYQKSSNSPQTDVSSVAALRLPSAANAARLTLSAFKKSVHLTTNREREGAE
jgi:hypothetical protein